jgi:hypothetical protein
MTVEIEDSLLTKSKNLAGRELHQQWEIGCIFRETRKYSPSEYRSKR